MGIASHELHLEFPQFSHLIDELKSSDQRFGEDFKRYAKLDQEIEGLERRDSPIGDDKLHRLKQKRLQLKDEIYQTLLSRSRKG